MTSRARPDDDLAAAVLPKLADLSGDGWAVDVDDDGADDGEPDGLGSGGVLDACLPVGFPEHALLAGDEIGFTWRDVAGLFAMSSVFADADAAALAWSMLDDDGFVQCFVSSIAGDVLPREGTELLGPVMRAVDAPARGDASVGAQVAMFANVDGSSARPLALRCAVMGSDRVVLLVWSVDVGDADADRRWAHLVARAVARMERAGQGH